MIPFPLSPALSPETGERESSSARKQPSSREAGYNLVILMMALTVFNIMIAIALPKWSHAIRREKEEELISRGFQYAEAIRVFQNRFQRLPVRIDELIKVEPRTIRKLWKDPMTDEGTWVLVPPGNGSPVLTPKPENPPDSEGRPQNDDREPSEELPDNTGIGDKKGQIQVGPFTGVHSRSSKESILIFNGRNRYDEWHFTVELLTQGGGAAGGPGGDPTTGLPPTGGLQLSTRWLGRPLPSFLQPAQGGGPQMNGLPQDGSLPGGSSGGRPGNRPGGKPAPR